MVIKECGMRYLRGKPLRVTEFDVIFQMATVLSQREPLDEMLRLTDAGERVSWERCGYLPVSRSPPTAIPRVAPARHSQCASEQLVDQPVSQAANASHSRSADQQPQLRRHEQHTPPEHRGVHASWVMPSPFTAAPDEVGGRIRSGSGRRSLDSARPAVPIISRRTTRARTYSA
jgi:hypothetical protein